jgi:hypothetical protein
MFELMEDDAMRDKRCLGCGHPLSQWRQVTNALFCDQRCRLGIYSASVLGGLAELAVAKDLHYKGYEVFRPLFPHASCDLAVLSQGTWVRVEVKTSTGLGLSRPENFDVRARVLQDGRIRYQPPIFPPLPLEQRQGR